MLRFVHFNHHNVRSEVQGKVRALHRATSLNGAIPGRVATLLKDVNAPPLELRQYKVLLSNFTFG